VRPATISRAWRRRSLDLIEAATDVLENFEGAMSTRQVFYQLVSRGTVANTPSDYDRIQRLLVHMRREGLVDYEQICDRTRSKHHHAGWLGAKDLMESAFVSYRRDYWADQEIIPQIAVEKQALEGVFSNIVDEYGVSLWVLRGYPSEAFAYEWANEIDDISSEGKQVRIFFFGDHDPSGLSLEQDCIRKLQSHDAEFRWERRGLLRTDFKKFGLVNVHVKLTDSRARDYLKKFGDRAAELDALPPEELQRRIRAAVDECIDVDAWNRLRRTEQAERDSLLHVSKNWDVAVEAARRAG
jgi:hypothetical protein